MTPRRPEPLALALLATAAAAWLGRDAVAWVAASAVPSLGYPACALLLQGLAALLLAAGVARLWPVLSALSRAALARIDALEARLDALPRGRGRAWRALGVTLSVGLAISLGVEVLHLGGGLETRALDLSFQLRFPERSQVELATGRELPSAEKRDDVVLLAVDDETVAKLGWPMPRAAYARLIDAVVAARPASLTFDISLVDPGRDHPEWDQGIGEAAQRAGNVGFSFTLSRLNGARVTPSDVAAKALEANRIPWQASAAGLPEYAELVGGDVAPLPVIDPVAANARALAMANVLLDGADDVLRHSLVVARLGQQLYPSLSLRLAAQALDVPLAEVKVVAGSHVDLGGKRRIPLDALGRTLVRYHGRHDTRGLGPFRYVSLASLLRADAVVTLAGNPLGDDQRFVLDEQAKVTLDGAAVPLAALESRWIAKDAVVSGKARYSTDPGRILELALVTGRAATEPAFELVDADVLTFTTTLGAVTSQRGDVSSLAGKHLLVGSTALAAADLRVSPLGEMPGVEHHATMLSNLLQGDLFESSGPALNTLVVLGAAFIGAAVGVALPGGLGLLLTGLAALLFLSLAFLSTSSGFYLPVVGPTAAMGASYLSCLVMGARAASNARLRAEQDRAFVRQTFGRYLTEQVVQQLLDKPDGLRLGGQRDFVTIMMTDLRGFTSMCGTMQPESVVKLLNHYLERMTRIITRYGGTIDEFIGDAILVVFGAPLPLEQEELRAVACAVEMLNDMPEVNRWNAANGLPEVEMGIGIHSGEVVLGNIGSELRAKYGIVGATINLTSRVESFTVGGQVLISEATRERCGDALVIGQTQVVSPKGVKGTLTIHEVLGVGGPFSVKLASANEALASPVTPLELRYAIVKGKVVAELEHVAHVEALSEQGLELRVAQELAPLSDLQLRVVDASGGLRPGDLYGKVLKVNVRPSVVYLRLTSVPPEVKPVLEAARGGARPPPAPVPDAVLGAH